MSGQPKVQEYYADLHERMDIETAVGFLGIQVTEQHGPELYCDCPRHASVSKTSLHINTSTQEFNCFGCCVGGKGSLRLVQFAKFGCVTKGSGKMPESHRLARDMIAKEIGLPILKNYGLSDEEIEAGEAEYNRELEAKACLADCVDFCYQTLEKYPEVKAILTDHYKFSEEIIASRKIGYACAKEEKELFLHLQNKGHSRETLLSTGAFRDWNSNLKCVFVNRIIFPYWYKGEIEYLIGRKTPWTPNNQYEEAKYKKLDTYKDDELRKHIAKCISNKHLYNEDILSGDMDYVIFTEGAPDCTSAMDNNFRAVSPVTVAVKDADWPRLLPKLAKVKTVYTIGDNEVSQTGLNGSLKIANFLQAKNIECRIVVLPLSDEQKAIRAEIKDKFRIGDHLDSKTIQKIRQGLSPEGRAELDKLAEASKVDLNSYFATGGTKEELQKLLDQAPTPIEFAISQLDLKNELKQRKQLNDILQAAAQQPVMYDPDIARAIKERLGKKASTEYIKKQIKEIRKQLGIYKKSDKKRSGFKVRAPEGTGANVLQQIRADLIDDELELRARVVAEAIFKWAVENGLEPFRLPSGEPFWLFGDDIYYPYSKEPGKQAAVSHFFFKQFGLNRLGHEEKLISNIFVNLVFDKSRVREPMSWSESRVNSPAIYFASKNEGNQIFEITPDGPNVVQNGKNPAHVLLGGENTYAPIEYVPRADREHFEDVKALERIIKNFSCSKEDARIFLLWLGCFLLGDFASSRGFVRFEGGSGCGKSTAARSILRLISGPQQPGIATVAALVAQGGSCPLVVADNYENRSATSELINFFLGAATGCQFQKRASNSDTGVITTKARCALISTGIEPFATHLAEIVNRQLLFKFRSDLKNADFMEMQELTWIDAHRDQILSFLMDCSSRVLGYVKSGLQKRAVALLRRERPKNNKSRLYEFIALMLLMESAMADCDVEMADRNLESLDPLFRDWLDRLDDEARETSCEENEIGGALELLFKSWQNAICEGDLPLLVRDFKDKYPVDFDSRGNITGATSTNLLAALRAISRNLLQFSIKSPKTLGRRISNDQETLRSRGFGISKRMLDGVTRYDITLTDSSDESQTDGYPGDWDNV